MAPQAGIPQELGAAVITGLGLMPEGEALSRAIEAKAWLDSALTSVSVGTTALSALSDPLHALFSGVANWAMEHIEPLKDWMNKLTGEPEHVRQAAAGWRGIGERLQSDAASLNQSVTTDMAETEGLAVSAYADMQRDTAAHIAVLGGYAKALAFLLEEASTVVQKVRGLVCKAISDVAAQAGKSAILVGCTLGFGTPIAVSQIASKVAEWAKKLSNIVNAVPRMAQAIHKTSQKGAAWLKRLDSGLKKRTAGKGSAHVVSKTSTKKTTKAPSKKANTSTPKTKATPKGQEKNSGKPGGGKTPKGGNTPKKIGKDPGVGSGPVVFKPHKKVTSDHHQQYRDYVDGCNRALKKGELSPTGRVSTKGKLRDDASAAAKKERLDNPKLYEGKVAGHVPDSTWTGKPEPSEWHPEDQAVNSSLGGQSRRYPIGYKPTSFHYDPGDGTGPYPPLPSNGASISPKDPSPPPPPEDPPIPTN